jgi:hypothetical protein
MRLRVLDSFHDAANREHDIREGHENYRMVAEVRYAGEPANHRNNGKDQRDDKNDLRWCIQSGHVFPLLINHLSLKSDRSSCSLSRI